MQDKLPNATIKDLERGHKRALASLVKAVYTESPDAMWFSTDPDDQELHSIFDMKLAGMEKGSVVDVIAEHGDTLVGECEIVKVSDKKAVVGIIIGQEERGIGLGDSLLSSAVSKAKAIGVTELFAEVKPSNTAALSFFKSAGFARLGSNDEIVTLSKHI